MATSVWRMNGICRRMAGILVLCTLLISSEVMCQDGTTITATVAATTDGGTGAAVSTVTSVVTSALDVVTHAAVDVPDAAAAAAAATAAAAGAAAAGAAASAAPGDGTILETRVDILVPTGPPVVGGDNKGSEISGIPDVSNTVKVVVPDVVCVGKEDLPESDAVKAVVHTTDCEATKRIIMDNAAPWCEKENCNLKIFQEDNTVSLASSDASHSTLASALQSEHLKDKLGVTKTETPSSSSSSVFVGILVTGLLCALAITVGYFKCQRKTETKGARLAEEAYPVDQENQGNTLVSVAPLNPPPETEEKPSVNGESPEAPKTEPAPPPTNGHSTTKTADTEL